MPRLDQVRHRCDQCTRHFARNEHLQRHRLTHNPVRSFTCGICFQKFVRNDALKRHENSHYAVSPTKQGAGASPTSRTTVACDRCARMKVRCDGNSPCDRCSKQEINCTLERDHVALKRLHIDHPLHASHPVGNESPQWTPNVGVVDFQLSQNAGYSPGHTRASSTSVVSTEGATARTTSSVAEDTVENFEVSGLHHGGSTLGGVAASIAQQTSGLELNWPGNDGTTIPNFNPDWDDLDLFFDEQGGPGLFPAMYLPDESSQSTLGGVAQTQPKENLKDHGLRYYSTYPQLYRPDERGNPLRTSAICDFLTSREAWDKVDAVEASLSKSFNSPIPKISEPLRDAIMATVHVVLAKVLDKEQMGRIPATFPPLKTIQILFRAYFYRVADFYPISHPSAFEIDSASQYNGAGPQLQLLTIFVSGALLTPVPEVQTFAVDLASIIHQVLYDIFLRNAHQTRDICLTSTSILITAFGIWSGNKRQMELAEALRGSYTTMMSRRGLHERAHRKTVVVSDNETEKAWKEWVREEKRRRLAYVWYVVEQEISLFNGVPATLSFSEMRSPMPSSKDLFVAPAAEKWKALLWEMTTRSEVRFLGEDLEIKLPYSLAAFHRLFLHGNIFQLQDEITPFQIRLLLCTIQTLVSHYSQTRRFLPEEEDLSPTRHLLSTSTEYAQLRREELHYLSVKWHLLYRRVMPISTSIPSGIDLACILMAHLIAMELYICFDDVQLFAGKEGFTEGRLLMPSFQRWTETSAAAKALSHGGQIIRIVSSLDQQSSRPLWWPLAVARAALILWAYGMAATTDRAGFQTSSPFLQQVDGQYINQMPVLQAQNLDRIDRMVEETTLFGGSNISSFDKGRVPCLSDRAGRLIPVLQTGAVLQICISLLREGESVSTPLCECVRNFLQDIQDIGAAYPGTESAT